MEKVLIDVKIKIRSRNSSRKFFKWKTFRGLLFSDFLMRTMSSIVKQAWSNLLWFNFFPLKAMFSFINVKSSLLNTFSTMFFFIQVFQLSSVQQGFLTMLPVQKTHHYVLIWCYLVSSFCDMIECHFGKHYFNFREHWNYCFLQIPLRNMPWNSWNNNIFSADILL